MQIADESLDDDSERIHDDFRRHVSAWVYAMEHFRPNVPLTVDHVSTLKTALDAMVVRLVTDTIEDALLWRVRERQNAAQWMKRPVESMWKEPRLFVEHQSDEVPERVNERGQFTVSEEEIQGINGRTGKPRIVRTIRFGVGPEE